jgi:hypothetical protein
VSNSVVVPRRAAPSVAGRRDATAPGVAARQDLTHPRPMGKRSFFVSGSVFYTAPICTYRAHTCIQVPTRDNLPTRSSDDKCMGPRAAVCSRQQSIHPKVDAAHRGCINHV